LAVLKKVVRVVVCNCRIKCEVLWLKPTISAMVFGGRVESEEGIQN